MARHFLAITLPRELRARLARLGAGVPGGRAPKPSQVHLTLRFAGELDEPLVRGWRTALTGVGSGQTPFALTVRGVGAFPGRGEPRVVWAGLAPSRELIALRAAVETASLAAGLEPDPRPFRPHVTLARLRRADRRGIRRWLDEHAELEAPPFRVEEVVLFASEPEVGGARHRRLESWPLRPRGGAEGVDRRPR